ncbi:MAG: uracil phosphoribosyltransferase [Algoriphagus sp.]|jgi:uracil phosphoribosyltransferase
MFILSETPSIANKFIAEMRDVAIQKDRLRFRKNLERLGELFAFEISKKFDFEECIVQTPIARTAIQVPKDNPVLLSIMRASLPFYQGFLNFFDHAESGFIGASREENENEDLSINLGYCASPYLQDRVVILADPMLATGKSILESINVICRNGIPKHLHIASIFAAPEGIKLLESKIKIPFTLWIGNVDQKLNDKFYIVPGLGDAGDLAFGPKI